MSGSVHFGYAQRPITPDLGSPTYLAGFDHNTLATSVHDDLWCRAVALRDESHAVILITLDLIGLARGHCLEIQSTVRREAGSAGAAVDLLIACSHTHFGPDTIGFWGPTPYTRGVDEAYMQRMKAATASVALDALCHATTPAFVRCAEVQVPSVARNARDPHIVDDEATCIQWCAADDRPLATLVVFPCHPEVLERGSTAITSDYVYELRRAIEAQTLAPALFMAGALGGMMTPDMGANTHAAAAQMGASIAARSLEALAQRSLAPLHTASFHRQELAAPLQNILFEQALQVGLLRDERDAAGRVPTEVGLLRLNECWLATLPGELLPALGLQIKASLRGTGAAQAGVIGLANDEIGYILPREVYVYPENPLDPGDHYEETMSLGPDTAPLLLAALTRLMDEAHSASRDSSSY